MIGANPSLVQGRQDCDLGASGSLTERPLRNRISKNSGPMNLSALANTVAGQQLWIPDGWNSTSFARNKTKPFIGSVLFRICYQNRKKLVFMTNGLFCRDDWILRLRP